MILKLIITQSRLYPTGKEDICLWPPIFRGPEMKKNTFLVFCSQKIFQFARELIRQQENLEKVAK